MLDMESSPIPILHSTSQGSLFKVDSEKDDYVFYAGAPYLDSIPIEEGSYCVSGGRDRNLALWNVKDSVLSEESGGAPPAVLRNNAHDGWIWALTAPSTSSNTIFSGSWDSNIKVWDLSTNLKCLQSFRCPLAVLCLTCFDENIAVAGLFAPQVVIIDIRTPDSIVASHKFHEASILEITQDKPGSNMIYTTSEDRFICAFDMRAGVLQQKKLLEPAPTQRYALSLAADTNVCSRALFAGDTRGSLHMFDLEGLKKISSVPIFPTSKITGLKIGPSALLACSQAGDIAVMNPSCPVNRVSTLRSSTNNITELQYENDVLAIGTCDSAVELWVPLDSPIFS